MNTKRWVMNNGKTIRIKDMSDTHLINAIKMLRRLHADYTQLAWRGYMMLQGEMATYYAEQEIDRMEEVESDHPLYDDLMNEVERRKLCHRLPEH